MYVGISSPRRMFIFATTAGDSAVAFAVSTGLMAASPLPFGVATSCPRRISCVYGRVSFSAVSLGHMLALETPPCGVRKCTKHLLAAVVWASASRGVRSEGRIGSASSVPPTPRRKRRLLGSLIGTSSP